MTLPTRKETRSVLIGTLLFFLLTGIFLGIRPEHIYLMGLFLFLFFASSFTPVNWQSP